MANFQYSIPNAAVARVVEAFAEVYSYADHKLEGETQGQFAERQVKEFIKRTVARHESSQAARLASANATAAVAADITIT